MRRRMRPNGAVGKLPLAKVIGLAAETKPARAGLVARADGWLEAVWCAGWDRQLGNPRKGIPPPPISLLVGRQASTGWATPIWKNCGVWLCSRELAHGFFLP